MDLPRSLIDLMGAVGLAASAAIGLSVPAHAGPKQSFELTIPANATFDHGGQQLMYRTRVSLLGDWEFKTGRSSSIEARLQLSPNDSSGLISWKGTNGTELGPTALDLTAAGTSEHELRQWRQDGGRNSIAPELIIPLTAAKTDQQDVQIYQNTASVTAAVFVRRCDGHDFLHYGDVHLESGALEFVFRLDETGEVHADARSSRLLLELNASTWEMLQAGCDPDDVVPALAVDGLSENLHGTSEPPNPPADSLAYDFEFLSQNLRILAFKDRLDEKFALQLMRIAERARAALLRARSEQTLRHLNTFRHRVRVLDRQGRLGANDAQVLVGGIDNLNNRLAGLRDLPLPEPDPALAACPGAGAVASCPDTLSSCAFTVLHVDAGTSAEMPDGTRARPFSTIGAALSEAEARDACGVSLRVEPGRYEEDLLISRHTKILGNTQADEPTGTPFLAGSVANGGPYFLEVRDLVLSAPASDPVVGMAVTHPCASTRLDNVAIVGYRGLGLHQEGGSFAFADLNVSLTRAIAGSPSAGTGILLRCGAKGSMGDITLRGNESAGLIAAGSGTDIETFDLVVAGTRVHPDVLTRQPTGIAWGAVHVRDGADFSARGFRIRHNWMIGLRVESGAEAYFEQGVISRTLGLDRVAPESGALSGGINLAAYERAHLTMFDFISTHADLCGAQVALEGELDLIGRTVMNEAGDREFTSQVSHSPIGACIQVPGYDAARLSTAVAYRNNDINLDAVDLEVPEPGEPGFLIP